jgi:hypothetical protein
MKNFLPDYKQMLDDALLMIDGVRPGLMFGCPGYYAAGGLAVCHYNDNLFVKLPAERAAALITSDAHASSQGPMGGRRSMGKEWIFLHVPDMKALESRLPLLRESIAFVSAAPPKPRKARSQPKNSLSAK